MVCFLTTFDATNAKLRLAMQKMKQMLVEHNALITAHYDMSAAEQNIFSLVLCQLNEDDPPDRRYKVSVKSLAMLTKSQINYQSVRSSAQKLLSRQCSITRENGNILDTVMISDSEYIKEAGYFKIGISPQLRPYLLGLKKNFTRYQLSIFGALKSKYSKRIYKMLSQFKHTGIMRVSVEELKKRLKLIDPKTKKETFKDWTRFTSKVLEIAKREINEFSDMRCTYEGIKTGRKFTDIEFKIARVPFEHLKAQYGEDIVTAELHKRLIQEFKLASWQANEIVIHVPEKEIRKTFHDIQTRRMNADISNMGGYAAKLFDSKYQLGFFGDKTTLKEASKASSSSTPIPPSNTEHDEQCVTPLPPAEMVVSRPPLAASSGRSSSYNPLEEPFTLGQRLKKNLGMVKAS